MKLVPYSNFPCHGARPILWLARLFVYLAVFSLLIFIAYEVYVLWMVANPKHLENGKIMTMSPANLTAGFILILPAALSALISGFFIALTKFISDRKIAGKAALSTQDEAPAITDRTE